MHSKNLKGKKPLWKAVAKRLKKKKGPMTLCTEVSETSVASSMDLLEQVQNKGTRTT